MGWDDARVDTLKKLWSEGLSASQIAGRLGHVTRNSVIGKVHRLGLSGRATTSRKCHRPKRADHRPIRKLYRNTIAPKSAARVAFPVEPLPVFVELDIPLRERKTLLDLDDRGCDCRWSIGDPQSADFHFCNRSAVPGLPYCEFHARRAFQPPKPATGRDFVDVYLGRR